MKRIMAFILFGATLVPWVSFGDVIPVQSFQQADTPAPEEKPATVNEPTKLQDKSPTEAVTVPAPDPAVKPAADHSGNTSSVDHESAAMLQAELTQLNQNNLQFQQQVDERLIELANKDQQLQQQLHQLTQALVLINQELSELKQMGNTVQETQIAVPVTSPAVVPASGWVASLKQHLGPRGFEVASAVVVLLLLLLIWSVWPRRKKETTDNDTKDEYDYMGSAESIPAKLNLARTYVAMEDYSSARQVLGEVMKSGNVEQQQEADELIKTLPVEV